MEMMRWSRFRGCRVRLCSLHHNPFRYRSRSMFAPNTTRTFICDERALNAIASLDICLTKARQPYRVCLAGVRVYTMRVPPVPILMPVRQVGQETSTDSADPQQAAVSSSSTHTPPPVDIPPEFYDPLTCEIMALPVLLPCGQTVDRTTLHRYCQEQVSKFGAPL